MKRDFYLKTAAELTKAFRHAHLSRDRVFVWAKHQPDRYHNIVLTDYALHATRGPILPRLNVNTTWAAERLPLVARKKWGIYPMPGELFVNLYLEVTFLPDEAGLIASKVPALINYIETGATNRFDNPFAMEFIKTTETNLWTIAADAVAKTS